MPLILLRFLDSAWTASQDSKMQREQTKLATPSPPDMTPERQATFECEWWRMRAALGEDVYKAPVQPSNR